MSDDTTDTAPAPPAPETPAEKTKRTRATWPIRICRVEGANLTPLKDAPAFSESDEARAWIKANITPGETWCQARIGPTASARVMIEEGTL